MRAGTGTPDPRCARLIVQDDLTCGTCGRDIAQYTVSGEVVWQHRRGATRGAMFALRQQLNVAERRAERAEARLAEVEEELADALRLDRIEAKIDTLLSRPAGVVEWKANHRRIVDGGEQVRTQRKRVDGMKRPAARSAHRLGGRD